MNSIWTQPLNLLGILSWLPYKVQAPGVRLVRLQCNVRWQVLRGNGRASNMDRRSFYVIMINKASYPKYWYRHDLDIDVLFSSFWPTHTQLQSFWIFDSRIIFVLLQWIGLLHRKFKAKIPHTECIIVINCEEFLLFFVLCCINFLFVCLFF